MKRWVWLLPVLVLAPLWACQDDDDPNDSPRVRREGEPRRVKLERILITYRGNPFDIETRRTLDEARMLAYRLVDRARGGEDFVKLRDGYSDDRRKGSEKANGPYAFLNYDVEIAPTMGDVPRMERMNMGRRLGDRAFQMRAGEIDLIEYHEEAYPVGYEIILCLQRDDRTEEQVVKDLAKKR